MANPTLLTMPMCVNADKNTIPPTDAGTSGLFSEELGFQDINSLPLASGGKAPNRRDFNGVFALLGGIAYACQRGQSFEWVNTLPYLAGCVVTDPLDGNKYNAKNDVAEGGTNPSLDPINWELANKDLNPIGTLINYAGNGALPSGYLACDGSAISRTTYAELFDVIGTIYGVGDGTTTFNLPNYIDTFAEGSAVAGVEMQAGLPNIKGSISGGNNTGLFVFSSTSSNLNGGQDGAFTTTKKDYTNIIGNSSYTTRMQVSFDASNANAIYSDSVTTVQPPALTCRILIKYE